MSCPERAMPGDFPDPNARLGATFLLLMKVRILLAGMSLLMASGRRPSLVVSFIVLGVGLLSWFALIGWEQIAPWLLRYPVLLGFDVYICYAPMQVGGVMGPFFLLTLVTSAVAGLLHRWPGMLLVCGAQVLLYYAALGHTGANFQTAVAMPAFYLVVGFVGTGLRRLFDDFAAVYEARRRAEIAMAAAEERNRLAREMHDSLAKTLRGIAMAARALPVWVEKSSERAGQEARRIAAATEIASREARELITDLRGGAVQQPIGVALGEIVRSAGLPACLAVEPGVELPLLARYELIAIVREALENVARHAGATAIEVRLRVVGTSAVLTVEDNGRGFHPGADPEFDALVRKGHYGLVGMRERAVRAGGTLAVASRPGSGTTLTITIPLGTAASRYPGLAEVR